VTVGVASTVARAALSRPLFTVPLFHMLCSYLQCTFEIWAFVQCCAPATAIAISVLSCSLCCCLQRTCEIWAFAFSFAWRYFLLNQKWTYPKKQGGMTPAAVSSRKSELAGALHCSHISYAIDIADEFLLSSGRCPTVSGNRATGFVAAGLALHVITSSFLVYAFCAHRQQQCLLRRTSVFTSALKKR
jgi:hypothetical protein